MKYRKKPVIIEAEQWNGFGRGPTVAPYLVAPERNEEPCPTCNKDWGKHGWILTLEGGHIVCPGDFIITGVKGEKYPCKPDVFALTYQAVGDPAEETTS